MLQKFLERHIEDYEGIREDTLALHGETLDTGSRVSR